MSMRSPKNLEHWCECGDTRWVQTKKWTGNFVKTFVGLVWICVHCGKEWEDLRSDHHKH